MKIAASLLPKDFELTVNNQLEISGILEAAQTYADAYRIARVVLIGDVVDAEIEVVND